MNGKDIINLQEAYLQVYSQPEISEEAEIAAEYFYEKGLDVEDVETLIEELGIDEFNELVYDILDEYGITELSEANAVQNWIAKQILQGMERHKQATHKLGQSGAGRALGAVGRGLTTVGDVGIRATDAAASAIDKKIEKARLKKPTHTKTPSVERTPVTRRHRSQGKLISGPRKSAGVTKKPTSTSSTASPSTSSSGKTSPPIEYGKPESSGQGTLFDTPSGKLSKPLSRVTAPKRPKAKRETGKYRQVPMRFPKQQKEDFELWVNDLVDEGYDLSDYTWDELYEKFQSPFKTPPARGRSMIGDPSKNERLGNPARLSPMMKSAQKSDQLIASEPGSPRQIKQTRRARHLENMYGAARQTGRFAEEYNLILSHLLDEGYAESLESAEAILESMSEDWVLEILEAATVMSVTSPQGKKRRLNFAKAKPSIDLRDPMGPRDAYMRGKEFMKQLEKKRRQK